MDFVFQRSYRGSVKGIVFDWAGTTVDYGCMAPAAVFVDVFAKRDVLVTQEQAREPMGMHKKDHIRILTQMDPIAEQWEAKFGARPIEEDVEEMFQEFVPMQLACIAKHADVIPGTVDTVKTLRDMGIKIGSTTGYNDAMMVPVMKAAAEQGYEPDDMVCVIQVPQGRPAPWMAVKTMMNLGVYPFEAVVKVGDTLADIGEGLNAGMWTVGLVRHGNEVGVPEADLDAMDPAMRQAKLDRAYKRLQTAGAHYVVDTIAEVPAVLEDINQRLGRGERP
jgi:phosphonoacetaldehyde hydrolase